MLVEKVPLMELVGTPHLVNTPLIGGHSLPWAKSQWSIVVHFPSFRIPFCNFRTPPLFLPIVGLYMIVSNQRFCNSKWKSICPRFNKKLGHPLYQTSIDSTIDRVIRCPSWFGENGFHYFPKVERDTLPKELILIWSPRWVTVKDEKKFYTFLLEKIVFRENNLQI